MDGSAFVVVFPANFAKNKQSLLVQNIKKVLKNQDQQFTKITTDDDLVIVEANDPVFASSAINLLFGIDQISIARCVENKFDTIVSAIGKIGVNLLLKGEQFYVKVEGHSSGYLPKDVEIASTAALIEKAISMDCRPGTEQKHDKMIHCFLTKKNAYISIFLDKGHGGVPHNSQGQQVLCCIFDELSAISCLETIKQGFDVRILVCYTTDVNLTELAKIINRIIPRTLNSHIVLDFFNIPIKQETANTIQQKILVVTNILCHMAKKYNIQKISLSLSPLVFPIWLIEQNINIVIKNKFFPWIALAGLDESLLNTAKEIGLGKYLTRIEKFGRMRFTQNTVDTHSIIQKAKKMHKTIKLRIGPNNVHDILDSLNH